MLAQAVAVAVAVVEVYKTVIPAVEYILALAVEQVYVVKVLMVLVVLRVLLVEAVEAVVAVVMVATQLMSLLLQLAARMAARVALLFIKRGRMFAVVGQVLPTIMVLVKMALSALFGPVTHVNSHQLVLVHLNI